MTPVTPMRQAGVLGHPIEHSLSPVLHRAAYAALALDWSYEPYDVDTEGLEGFLLALDSTWAGLSLTMPLKEQVLPFLTTTSSAVDLAQAANTVLLDEQGRHGHNTDIGGLVEALRERSHGSVAAATILGTGATARSSLIALAEVGADEVTVVGRSPVALDRLVALGRTLGVAVEACGWDAPVEALKLPLVVSTVPAEVAARLVPDVPERVGTLFDVLYDPWPTPLADVWAGRGSVIGGLDLLIHQAAAQVSLMTGRPAPVAQMRAAGVAALAQRRGGHGRLG